MCGIAVLVDVHVLNFAAPTLQDIDDELKSTPAAVQLDTVSGSNKSVVKMLRTGLDIETDQYVVVHIRTTQAKPLLQMFFAFPPPRSCQHQSRSDF